jgi:hypothetical protein
MTWKKEYIGLNIIDDPKNPTVVIKVIMIIIPSPGKLRGRIPSILLKAHTTKAPVTVIGTINRRPCKK